MSADRVTSEKNANCDGINFQFEKREEPLLIEKLAQSHAKEIMAMTRAINRFDKTRNTAQTVPRNMRRRAASHNLNRLPRRIKEQIKKLAEKKPGVIPQRKQKPPSRYHRRRPKNLVKEFTKRQVGTRWLETHLWHTKRFHMERWWGYKLPLKPTDKSTRACYRAIQDYCLIQDISYYHGIELYGERSLILSKLLHLMPLSQDALMENSAVVQGKQMLTSMLHKFNHYPNDALAQVEVAFRGAAQRQCQVWIWCHICAYEVVWKEICSAFSVDEEKSDNVCLFASAVGEGVNIISLRNDLIRFRLLGRKTMNVLQKMLQPSQVLKDNDVDSCTQWWHKFYNNDKHRTEHDAQSEWLTSSSPREAISGEIYAATVQDPRLHMPKILELKKTDIVKLPPALEVDPIKLCSSPLWNVAMRNSATLNKISDQELNTAREKLLVPGEELHMRSNENAVPLLLIKGPGSIPMWDVILPSGWGMPFWLAAIYAGSHAGGLKESLIASAENGLLHFPMHFIDTPACKEHDRLNAEDLVTKYHKYPPAKRPNFDCLGVPSPFTYDWERIIPEDSMPAVVRKQELLHVLYQVLCADISADSLYKISSEHGNIVAMEVTMVNRGVPEERALVSVALSGEDANKELWKDDYGPTEKIHKYDKMKRDKLFRAINPMNNSRRLLGFVKHGRLSPKAGQGKGLAFLSLSRVKDAIINSPKVISKRGYGLIVLIRSAASRQYRYAYAQVLH